MDRVISLLVAILAAALVHEGGHWLAARAFGHRLRFCRSGFRWIWTMPEMPRWKQRIVAIAGFGLEFLAAGVLLVTIPTFGRFYTGVALAHLVAYPFYSGRNSDFQWL